MSLSKIRNFFYKLSIHFNPLTSRLVALIQDHECHHVIPNMGLILPNQQLQLSIQGCCILFLIYKNCVYPFMYCKIFKLTKLDSNSLIYWPFSFFQKHQLCTELKGCFFYLKVSQNKTHSQGSCIKGDLVFLNGCTSFVSPQEVVRLYQREQNDEAQNQVTGIDIWNFR